MPHKELSDAILDKLFPGRRTIGPHSTKEEIQKAYLESIARYEESVNIALRAFFIGKGYSDSEISRNGEGLFERHKSEIVSDMRDSSGLVFQAVRTLRIERDELKARASS